MAGVGWAFRNDVVGVLVGDLGWVVTTNNPTNHAPTSVASDVWTYSGSPTRYSWGCSLAQDLTPPVDFQPALVGCWSIAYRNAGTGSQAGSLMAHNAPSGATLLQSGAAVITTYYLIVASVTKYTSPVYDTAVFHYLTLKSNVSANPWIAQMWVDGIMLADESHAQVAQASSSFVLRALATGAGRPGIFAQLEFWDSWSDPSEEVKYCTWVPLTEDVSETGAWTPDTGTDDYARVVTPFNSATYTENATPLAGDRVDMGIGGVGGTDDLSDALGMTPGTIHGITGYCYSTGSGGHSAFAVLGDGTSETDGGAVLIDPSNTTGTVVSSDDKPSGGAWSGTSQPILSYERQ